MTLADEIKQAFPLLAAPPDLDRCVHGLARCPDVDCMDAAKFRGVRWSDVPEKTLRRYQSPRFTAQQWAYYLPAWMTATLTTSDMLVTYADRLVEVFLDERSDCGDVPSQRYARWKMERVGALTKDQLLVVQKWLEWCQAASQQSGLSARIPRALATVRRLVT